MQAASPTAAPPTTSEDPSTVTASTSNCSTTLSELSVVQQPHMATTMSEEQFERLLQRLTPQVAPQPVTIDHSGDRFKSRDIGYFDPTDEPDAKPVETQDGKTVYHNVFSFTNRLRVKAATDANASMAMAKNLDQCLLGKAERWFTEEISNTTRAGLQTSTDLWCAELEARFREAPGIALAKLERLAYTIADVRARKDPEDYIQQVVINGRNAGTATTEAAQVMMAFNHMDVRLRTLLPQRPSTSSTIADFLRQCQEVKHDWFDMYAPQQPRRLNDYGKPQRGGRNMPSTSSFVPGSKYFSSTTTESTAASPAGPIQWQSKSQQNRTDRPIKQEQRGQGFQSRQPREREDKRRPLRDNRKYDSKNKGRPYKAKAYHVDDDQENIDPASDNLDGYDPEFYHGTHLDDDDGDKSTSSEEGSQVDIGFNKVLMEADEIQDVGFIAAKHPPRPRKCTRCGQTFPSGNTFHHHLPKCKQARLQKPSRPTIPKPSEGTLSQSSLDPSKWSTAATAGSDSPQQAPAEPLPTSSDQPEPLSKQEGLPVHGDPSTKNIIHSQAPLGNHKPGYGYRGFQYATLAASIGSPANDQNTLCADSGCVMSLVDRKFLKKYSPTSEISTMPTSVRVKGVGDKLHDANQYTNIDVYIPTLNGCIAHFRREFHIVDGLDAHALIGTDILYPEGWVLEFPTEEAILTHNLNIRIRLQVVARDDEIQRTVFSKEAITIPPHHKAVIPLTGVKGPLILPLRDFVFEPSSLRCNLFAALMNNETKGILAENDTAYPITIKKHTKLGRVHETQVDNLNLIPSEATEQIQLLASRSSKMSWKRTVLKGVLAAAAAYSLSPNSLASPAPISASTTFSKQETRLPNGITVYGDTKPSSAITSVVDEFLPLWQDRGQQAKVPEEEQMEIPLIDNWESHYKPGQARVYPVGPKDRGIIDQTFDKLHQQGRLEWTKSHTPFSFPCFVVWKNTMEGPKGRVVIDIRALNKITVPDAYPIPVQSEILALLFGCPYISTVDCASFFYQFLVKRKHRHRLTVATHRGQETFNCALMGYRNSPAYVQRMIDRVLRKHRAYARAYIDDIVIFSHSLEEHLQHLRAVFAELLKFNICLSPKKSFLGYPSVQLLGQKVDALGLATDKEKLAAIARLCFPRNLRQLDHYLGLTGYLRQYIPYYSAVAKPLQDRKTRLYKILRERRIAGNARKREAGKTKVMYPTVQEFESFNMLQKLFTKPDILHHFDPKRTLYIDIDASKETGFGVYAYHVKGDPTGMPKQKSQQPILFLSKILSAAETRYWPTELEVAALVWTVKKLRHMIEASHQPTIVYTDHQAIIDIAKQSSLNTSSVVRLNLRHVRASEYLSRFRLDIRHKAGKANTVPDALSRLPTVTEAHSHLMEQAQLQKATVAHPAPGASDEAPIMAYPVAVVELSAAFRRRIRQAYEEDAQCRRILEILEGNRAQGEDAARLPFTMHRRLIYFDDLQLGLRLVIPKALDKEIFQAAHDQTGHPGYARTHERLSEFYIFNISKKLKEYITYCPDCQSRRTPRHRPFGSLQPILTPAIPFHTLTLDFILALPISVPDRYDCTLTVTDKFSKAVTVLPGMTSYDGAQWASRLLDRLNLINWGVPQALISDRDRKFLGQLWTTILEKLNVRLIFTTAWHPSADGMSERSNQTIEIALRYLIATLDNIKLWPTVLPRLSIYLNNSTSRATTKTSTQVLYGRRVKEALDLARAEANLPITEIEEPDNDATYRQRRGSAPPAYPATPQEDSYMPTHVDAKDALALAAMVMKQQYDKRHTQKYFQVGDWVSLRLHKGYTVPGLKNRNHKIEQQFAGPFEVVEKINPLAYRIRLPPSMNQIHPVISIAHLEPAAPLQEDPYQRAGDAGPVLTHDGQVNRHIERLLSRRDQRRRNGGVFTQYLVRYQGLGVEYDEWKADQDIPIEMRRGFHNMG